LLTFPFRKDTAKKSDWQMRAFLVVQEVKDVNSMTTSTGSALSGLMTIMLLLSLLTSGRKLTLCYKKEE